LVVNIPEEPPITRTFLPCRSVLEELMIVLQNVSRSGVSFEAGWQVHL
jgi:hypothetical protein